MDNSFLTVVHFIIGIIVIVSYWKLFVKAGYPGWYVLIPIFNTYICIKIAGRPGWWVLLFFVPIVNIVIMFIVVFDFAKAFGKDVLYGLGLIFLGFIFAPMLAFSDAKYLGSSEE